MEIKEFQLNFKFKGTRPYVHGTDIYNQLVGKLIDLGYRSIDYFELVYKDIATRNLTCYIANSLNFNPEGKVVAKFKLKHKNVQKVGILAEIPTGLIHSSYAYNETPIYKLCKIEENGSTLLNVNQITYSAIEVIVAMGKHYLCNLNCPENKKWLFRSLKTTRYINFSDYKQIDIELVGQKSDIKVFDVRINKSKVGTFTAFLAPINFQNN